MFALLICYLVGLWTCMGVLGHFYFVFVAND